MEFDENKAIQLINKALVDNGRRPYPDDEILNIIDMIWDYYEENGLLDIDPGDESDDDIVSPDELLDYVKRMLKKDRDAKVVADDLHIIINTELEYEDSLLQD
ncbi:MAG: hypothetical protein NC082_01125 [Clostridiales bacterium]|nr:hypothetical protein [Clostridiales bacterium]